MSKVEKSIVKTSSGMRRFSIQVNLPRKKIFFSTPSFFIEPKSYKDLNFVCNWATSSDYDSGCFQGLVIPYNQTNQTKEIPREVIKKIFKIVDKKAEKLSIEEIRKEIKKNPSDLIWSRKYRGKFCKIIKVNPNILSIDESHNNCLNSIMEPRGTKLKYYFDKYKTNPEVERRTKFVSENWDLLKLTWIVVKEYEGSFEVMSGNHRVIIACEKGLREIEVLCLCEDNDSEKIETLNLARN